MKLARCAACGQEVEPTVGEALCRLFPPDENIDLTRIAKIAKQSLKRRDAGGSSSSAAKSSVTASRSASSAASLPVTESSSSSSSRSDMLLLGLPHDDPRTLPRRSRRTSAASSALGTVRGAAVTVQLRDLYRGRSRLLWLWCYRVVCAGHSGRKSPAAADSEMDFIARACRQVVLAFGLSTGRACRQNCAELSLRDLLRFSDRPTCWSEDFPAKIPRRTFLPSQTLSFPV